MNSTRAECKHCGNWEEGLNPNLQGWNCRHCLTFNKFLKSPFVIQTSDGSSADYYKLPEGATQLQELISHCDMNAQMGEIFRATYRYGRASHSDRMRDAKKIKFYIEAELARLEKLK